MPLKIVLLRPHDWSRLNPYYSSTITTVKGFNDMPKWSFVTGGFAQGRDRTCCDRVFLGTPLPKTCPPSVPWAFSLRATLAAENIPHQARARLP